MRSLSRRLVTGFLVILASLAIPVRPSPQQSQPKSDAELRVLTVTVKNRAGHYVMGAPREAFELTDEKEKRPIEFFENLDTPVSIGILIDTSASMQTFELKEIARPAPIGDAIWRFLELSNGGNEYFLMAFDRTPRLLSDWTGSQALFASKTDIATQGRSTAL